VLCDTNGGTLPWRIKEVIENIQKLFPDVRLGIHAHNDGDVAVANSLIALEQGVMHIQGTFNG